MGRFVNPDNSAFQVALNSEIYIDKTGLLELTNKVLNTTDGYICNSRPRRFGKSITANMITAYYSKGCNSETMFQGLAISQKKDFKQHLNKYDVIHLDIQWFLSNVKNTNDIVFYITNSVIEELKKIYPKELIGNDITLPEALSQIKEKTGQKFIVIIDEWDVLIRDEAANKKIQEDYINFLRGMFKGTEPTKYIQLAYITGILPIKREKTQSALNNFDEYTMLDAQQMAPYIGFTDEEVLQLCKKYHRDYKQTKQWYDGYILEEEQIYNPRAVVSLMTKGKYKSYWSETGSYKVLVPLINMDFVGIKTSLIELLSGTPVEVDVSSFVNDISSISCKDDVLTYMIHLGYLGYDQNKEKAFIPNEEIRQELMKAVKKKSWHEFDKFQMESVKLIESTMDMDSHVVAEQIDKIHTEYTSMISYNNEISLSSVISIAYLSTMDYYFKPIRELPTGRGFADLVYIPKPEYLGCYPALVIELKWNTAVQTALNQIKEKKYPEALLEYTGDVLLVAINYDKSSKRHQCMIEKYSK